MTHTYRVEGMTCNGCVTSIKNHLSEIEEVNNVTVDLENKEAKVEMSSHVPLQELQRALPEKYTIQLQENTNIFKSDSNTANKVEDKSKFQQLKPLFLILAYITVASLLLHRNELIWSEVMLDFMGLFLIVFSFFKMLDLEGFPESFAMYDPLAKRFSFYGKVYPFLETILGLMFLFRFQITIAVIVTLLILGITTYGVTKTLLDKKSIQCACLGTALKLPMTEATFIENAIMILMGVFMLFKL